jgi:hypothetical protein
LSTGAFNAHTRRYTEVSLVTNQAIGTFVALTLGATLPFEAFVTFTGTHDVIVDHTITVIIDAVARLLR